MISNDPLIPIRRAVGESVATLKKFVSPETKPERLENNRILCFENLEDRRVLSVSGFETDPALDPAYVTSDFDATDYGFQDDTISHLQILVNGEIRTLTPAKNTLELVEGDHVEVVEIGYYSNETTGVFAAEGYVSKIGDLSSASLNDYNDGRFSGRERDSAANGGYGTIGGLANEWVVESGWDRLTINLVHYDVDSTEVGARFFAQLQVGQPDFEFDTDHLDTILEQEIMVGDAVNIPARWMNNLAGNFHNYAEVDIYHSSDTETIVWAGATVGNASADNSIGGEFLNTRESDPFSERWTPDVPGEYILKYYLDPERIVNETNEDNNQYEIRLTVKEKPAPIAVDDSFEAGQSLNVMQNDSPTFEAETSFADDFETDSLNWIVDPYGTDEANKGIWEATDPVGTGWNGVQLQLEDAASGDKALVTDGRGDKRADKYDVDGGVTSALSEAIFVPDDPNAVLSFKYTFAHDDTANSEDFFRVSVIGQDQTTVVLEERGNESAREGKWHSFTANLNEFADQEIQLLVEVADNGKHSLIEAGFDDVKVEIPAAPMVINEFSQGEHGSVSLNADGTLNYSPEEGFEGEDRFQYTVTDGESVSNVATVTINVEVKDFDVATTAAGDEDSAIELSIFTEYDQVKIEDVPADALLSKGEPLGDGVYVVKAGDLDGLTILPAENSDADFRLTVTPGENGVYDQSLTQTIDVVVNAVVDGADFKFLDFGIVTGKHGKLPVSGGFFDLDGSESHVITLNGLPDFVTLSAGSFDGVAWVLEVADLEKLEIEADKVSDTSDWDDYDKKNVFKAFKIQFAIESFEENGTESTFQSGTFDLFAIQKKKYSDPF